jgi:hypothetical protein
MMSKRFKYCLCGAFTLIVFAVYSQQTNINNEAVVTIVGNAPQTNTDSEPHDFINSNPYYENNEPQMQQEMTSQNIDPTLENGFHIRFELNSEQQNSNIQKADNLVSTSGFNPGSSSSSSSSSGGASVGKTKKRGTSLAERSFNAKKRLKTWLPKRKKRYHPHLCGRF